jgi:signal transduction histidine kinase
VQAPPSGIQVGDSRGGSATSAPPIHPGDVRLTSALRLVLAAASTAIFWADPSEHLEWKPYALGILVLFLAYAAAVHLITLRRRPWPPPAIAPWIDLAWVTLLISVSAGTSSIFFQLYLFAILCASFQGGFRAGMAIVAASVVSFSIVGGLTSPEGPSFELDRTLIRPLYLLVLGFLISHLGGHERRLRSRLALLRDISTLSNPRFGIDHTLGHIIARLCTFFGADACRLAVTEGGRAWTRKAARDAAHASDPIELPPELAEILVPPSDEPWLRRARFRLRELRRANVVEPLGASDRAQGSRAEAAATALGADSLLSAPFNYAPGVRGRLYVTSARPAAFDRSDLEFLVQAAAQTAPLLQNVRLVETLATGAAEEERKRIALDLHDSVIQPYVGLRLALSALRDAIRSREQRTAEITADRLCGLADRELEDLRSYARGLATRSEGHPGGALVPAVRRFCARYQEATGITVEVEARGSHAIHDRLAAEIFQVIAEGLSNVRRHTASARARVRIAWDEERLSVAIENDGVPVGSGLDFLPRSLTERASALGGRVDVDVSPETSITAVHLEIPL